MSKSTRRLFRRAIRKSIAPLSPGEKSLLLGREEQLADAIMDRLGAPGTSPATIST